MDGKRVNVFLGENLVRMLCEFCRQNRLSKSRVMREALLSLMLGKHAAPLVKRCLLEHELDDLLREEKRLRRLSDKILANNVYLRSYAKRLMLGGFENDAQRYRPPLTCSPSAAEIIRTFEGIFSHRQRVGERMAEIARELYPGEYGLTNLPSSAQNTRHIPVNNVRAPKEEE